MDREFDLLNLELDEEAADIVHQARTRGKCIVPQKKMRSDINEFIS